MSRQVHGRDLALAQRRQCAAGTFGSNQALSALSGAGNQSPCGQRGQRPLIGMAKAKDIERIGVFLQAATKRQRIRRRARQAPAPNSGKQGTESTQQLALPARYTRRRLAMANSCQTPGHLPQPRPRPTYLAADKPAESRTRRPPARVPAPAATGSRGLSFARPAACLPHAEAPPAPPASHHLCVTRARFRERRTGV